MNLSRAVLSSFSASSTLITDSRPALRNFWRASKTSSAMFTAFWSKSRCSADVLKILQAWRTLFRTSRSIFLRRSSSALYLAAAAEDRASVRKPSKISHTARTMTWPSRRMPGTPSMSFSQLPSPTRSIRGQNLDCFSVRCSEAISVSWRLRFRTRLSVTAIDIAPSIVSGRASRGIIGMAIRAGTAA